MPDVQLLFIKTESRNSITVSRILVNFSECAVDKNEGKKEQQQQKKNNVQTSSLKSNTSDKGSLTLILVISAGHLHKSCVYF